MNQLPPGSFWAWGGVSSALQSGFGHEVPCLSSSSAGVSLENRNGSVGSIQLDGVLSLTRLATLKGCGCAQNLPRVEIELIQHADRVSQWEVWSD